MIHDMYDLVKVKVADDRYFGAIGIIKEIHKDIDSNELYELMFAGKLHNQCSKEDGALFLGNELEGI